jgi:Holliday junction resolvase
MNSRNKGVNFERAIARHLRKWWPEARRGLQYQDGDYTPDVVNTPFYIECKRAHDKYITVNYGKGKQIRYTDSHKDIEKILEYYHERMKKWNHGNMPVLLIWKFDRKEIHCAWYFSCGSFTWHCPSANFSFHEMNLLLEEFYKVTGENNVKEKEKSKAETTKEM